MFRDHIAGAISGARPQQLDELSRAISGLLLHAKLSDDDASFAYSLIAARRDALRGPAQPTLPGIEAAAVDKRPALPRHLFPPRRKPQRSPDRARSIARRRQLAFSGPLPPQLGARFTLGQLSVLAIIADEAGINGQCIRCLDELAARAGVCRTTARNAIREAEKQGLLVRKQRRRPGRANLTNVITLLSQEWKTWLKNGPKRARSARKSLFETGVKKLVRTGTYGSLLGDAHIKEPRNDLSGGLRPPTSPPVTACD